MSEAILVCQLRPARKKARGLALAEALAILAPLGAEPLPGGPLADQRGVFWLRPSGERMAEARALLPRLAYTIAVDAATEAAQAPRLVRWRGQDWRLERIYEEDADVAREAAPDRRQFLARVDGGLREIRGYRGDGAALSRRGLPAYDARLLVNLTAVLPGQRLLDPFAGVGGVVIEAQAAGAIALSGDIDPWLADGLGRLAAGRHAVADCRWLPYADNSIDAIAAEAPFDEAADAAVQASLPELGRILKPGGRLALMAGARQAPGIVCRAAASSLRQVIHSPLDRKGMSCVVLLWEKA